MVTIVRSVCYISLVVAACGCGGGGQLSIVRPVSALVGDDRPAAFDLDPLRYTAQSAEGHLVLQIYNPTAHTVRLLGRQSSVVDPAGQSHPLLDQTIAPGSHVKLIEPPVRPWYGQPFELQLGGSAADPDGPAYWGWPGQSGDVRLHLNFEGGRAFEHDLVFRRTVGR